MNLCETSPQVTSDNDRNAGAGGWHTRYRYAQTSTSKGIDGFIKSIKLKNIAAL